MKTRRRRHPGHTTPAIPTVRASTTVLIDPKVGTGRRAGRVPDLDLDLDRTHDPGPVHGRHLASGMVVVVVVAGRIGTRLGGHCHLVRGRRRQGLGRLVGAGRTVVHDLGLGLGHSHLAHLTMNLGHPHQNITGTVVGVATTPVPTPILMTLTAHMVDRPR